MQITAVLNSNLSLVRRVKSRFFNAYELLKSAQKARSVQFYCIQVSPEDTVGSRNPILDGT